ncbi:MAG: hypothetical protein NZ703_08635 [Gemmataceae bacterium]|nr:hypothetical protein [Gemmataceae bacterium]MCS7271137.1 hypothetical protein [Gemmataceae bacterium]MDW8243093.1 hypothetical protein [Thermogemmata sp.]
MGRRKLWQRPPPDLLADPELPPPRRDRVCSCSYAAGVYHQALTTSSSTPLFFDVFCRLFSGPPLPPG